MTISNNTTNGNYLGLRDAMNRLMEDSFIWNTAAGRGGSANPEARLPIDAYSTDNELVVTAAVPGVNPDDVQITYENDTLTISGQMPQAEADRKYLLNEMYHGRFVRTLHLNVPVDASKIEATFENGILTVVLPKSEAVKPRTIQVKTKK